MNDITYIIVPGWGGSSETWSSFVDTAKPVFGDVRVINLPCFGSEPCPTTIWGVEEYAQFLTDRIEALHLDRIVLIAHSFGGAVATHALSQKNLRVEKLVLIGPAIVRKNITIKRLFFTTLAKTGKAVFSLPIMNKFFVHAQNALYKAADSPDYQNTKDIQRDIYKKIVRQDQTGVLSGIKIPTLLIWGRRDEMTPYSDARAVLSGLPHATLKSIEDGRHGLHHTHADTVITSIQDFVHTL